MRSRGAPNKSVTEEPSGHFERWAAIGAFGLFWVGYKPGVRRELNLNFNGAEAELAGHHRGFESINDDRVELTPGQRLDFAECVV